MRRSTAWVAVLVTLGAAACAPASRDGAAPAPQAEPWSFVDVSAAAGLTRVVLSGRPGKDHLLDSAGTGAAWIDYDRDGWLDAYIVNGWKLSPAGEVLERGRNALYRNRGDGTFEDVTDAAGVDGAGRWGSGVAVADVDADGWPDLFVTTFGENLLYRNRGDGTFEEIGARAGVTAAGWNTGAALFDADGDGDLDLYVAAYIETSLDEVLEARATLDWKGAAHVAMGPFGMLGGLDHYFVNRGGARFEEATHAAGLDDIGRGYGFTVVASDLDEDGDTDLYVANDSDANYLYRNDGSGHFQDVGLWAGGGLDAGGAAQAGMGVAAGDADGDGVTDLVVTNFSEDFTTLYHGVGGGLFEDVSAATGVGAATRTALSWGVVLADLDLDGDEDLVVANGHIYPQVDEHPEFGLRYAQRNLLLDNAGAGYFTDATARAGAGFALEQCSRGLAMGDYDNDGDLDLLLTQLDGPPTLLRNDGRRGGWLVVVPEGPRGGPPPVGTRVTVEVGERVTTQEVASSGSFLSAHDPRPHFGLGSAPRADRVTVIWPDGVRRVLDDVEADQFLVIPRP